jgi:hypothetical protein
MAFERRHLARRLRAVWKMATHAAEHVVGAGRGGSGGAKGQSSNQRDDKAHGGHSPVLTPISTAVEQL